MTGLFSAALLSLHLLAVNLAAGGPLVSAWLDWLATRDLPAANLAAKHVAKWSLWGLLVGALTGGGLALAAIFGSDARYAEALGRIPIWNLSSGWLIAAAELVVYVVPIVACVVLWDRWRRRRWVHRTLAVFAGLNLLYHFPLLFTSVAILAQRPEFAGRTFDRALRHELLCDGETLARCLHVILASLAVAGLAAAWAAARSTALRPERSKVVRAAGKWTLAATLAQLVSGVWLLTQIPTPLREALLGGEWQAAACFGLALLLALRLMHQLAGIALGDAGAREVRSASATLALTVLLMVLSLRFSGAR